MVDPAEIMGALQKINSLKPPLVDDVIGSTRDHKVLPFPTWERAALFQMNMPPLANGHCAGTNIAAVNL